MKIIEPKFIPRPYQESYFRDFFVGKKRRLLRILHRRAGKDHEAFNLIWMAALMKPGLYLYLLPVIHQANSVIWQGRGKEGVSFLDYIPKQIISKTNNTTMKIHLVNGSIIRVTGSDNFEALIGSNPLGIVFSEYQSSNPMAWDLLRPILAENGGWASFNGTPRGHNHLYDIHEQNKDNPSWSVSLLTANDTKYEDGRSVITPEIIEEERRSGMDEDIIQQEFYCSFEAAIKGAYFSEEMKKAKEEGRINDFDVDPNIPVHTAWDLGISDATSVGLYQVYPNGAIKCIYHWEETGKDLGHFVFELMKLQQKLKFKRFGMHFFPHDVRVRELGTGRTRVEVIQKAGLTVRIVPNHLIVERIQCMRHILNRVHFHKTNCAHLIRCLLEYHAKYDTKKLVNMGPNHNWASHAVDQIGYFSVGYMDAYDSAGLQTQKKYASFRP